MKKYIIILAVLTISFLGNPFVYTEAEEMRGEQEHGHHKFIDCDKMEELKGEGYSKEEIYMAAMLAKNSDNKIEEVLALYKEQKSWKKTAKQLGISTEDYQKIESMQEWKQFLKNNKDEVIDYLATYTDKKPEEIMAYLEDDISLRFLIGASALAKLSDKELDDILTYKKEGQSFHNIMENLEVDEEDFHHELRSFKSELKSKIGNE